MPLTGLPALCCPLRAWWRGVGLGLLALAASAAVQALEPAIAVVMAHNPPAAQQGPLSPQQVYAIYARKRQLWPDRAPVQAVNLPIAHPVRRSFSQWVFKHSPEDLQDYWNDQYFHGVLPPPVLGSEEAVLRFVAATPGAIGYVSACAVDKRVEVVALIQGPDGAAACRP
jgi:ABC-type phosphate transport system substrate-binding protein